MHRPLVILCALFAVGCASKSRTLSRPAEPPPFLSPAQVMKRMEASAVQYRVEGRDSPPGGWADQLWPQRVSPREAPRVKEENGERVIVDWPGNPPAVNALLDEAEPHFEARRYAEAAKLYEQATNTCPDCYLAWNFRGDAALFSGDAATALEHYRRAIQVNPNDHRSWFFQGNALARLGRFKEALDSWAWCLVLNPRYAIIRDMFRNNAGLGLAVLDEAIVPRGYAEWAGEAVSVQFDPDHDPSWLAFANCKALWLGEPSHRREMTGSADERFSTLEEVECLGSALVVHGNRKDKGETDHGSDPSLDRLTAITQDGMLTEAVLFEVGTRIHPQIVLTLDDDVRQRLKTYVLKHVLVPVPTAGGHDL
ncbi:tetratricopeptide repeat protein [Myxococcus landrumensis]|uniref:Tetratricopeptide repeat protein n=2 Tax=Myxococcus landrumensis TaxID=2813577 RepID=A0ABX7ND89_9BACT|nr:tetratricopeptide repeat protein [Myxococcus landrumus]